MERFVESDVPPDGSRSDYSMEVLRSMRCLWEDEQLLDYSIHTEDGTSSFRVHKVLLCSVSDYFKAMLTGGMQETGKDSVQLHGVPHKGDYFVYLYVAANCWLSLTTAWV